MMIGLFQAPDGGPDGDDAFAAGGFEAGDFETGWDAGLTGNGIGRFATGGGGVETGAFSVVAQAPWAGCGIPPGGSTRAGVLGRGGGSGGSATGGSGGGPVTRGGT